METPASSIDLAMNMDQKYRVVGGVASEMGSLFFVFIRKATAFSEYRVQWPVEKERRGRYWRGKENRETAPWVVEIAWDPEHVWVSLLTSRKLTLQQSMCGLAFRQVENTLQQSTCGLAFRQASMQAKKVGPKADRVRCGNRVSHLMKASVCLSSVFG